MSNYRITRPPGSVGLIRWLRRKLRSIQLTSCERLQILEYVWQGDLANLKNALSRDVDPNLRAAEGIPLINSAILSDKMNESAKATVIELLLDEGGTANVIDSKGTTPLMLACAGGYNELVDLLLSRAANPNQVDSNGDSALFFAASSGNSNAVRKLVSLSVDVNLKNKLHRTALMWAAREGHLTVVQQLVEAGAHIQCQDIDGVRLIRQSAFQGHRAVTEYLLNTCPEEENHITFTEAASAGMLANVTKRISEGVEISQRNLNGLSALDLAIMHNHQDVVTMLIRQNLSSAELGHALGVAVLAESVEFLSQMLAAGAAVDHQDETGTTPLMLAVERNLPHLVRLLINAGANPKLLNAAKDNAIDIAQRCRAYDALQELFKHQ